jgi:hypothetical protein
MEIIKNNPYRTLGLLVGASMKEERSKHKRLRMLIEAGQDIPEDFSFPALGTLNRDLTTVEAAHLQLDLDKDRVNAAIFWFYDGGTADEPAFDYLKEGKIDSAIRDCWNKAYPAASITKTNSSAFHNLSTLQLHLAINGSSIDARLLEEAIALKLRYLDSEFCSELIRKSTDETFKTSREVLQRHFLNQLQNAIEKNGGITITRYFEIISRLSFSAKDDYIKDFIKVPIEQLETQIEETTTKRNAKATNAINAGNALMKQTATNYEQLKLALGPGDLKFDAISDKLAEELLMCATVYFEHHKESENKQTFDAALKLVQKAKYFALGQFITLRIDEYISYLEKWIDDIETIGKVKVQFEALGKQFDSFDTWAGTQLTAGVYCCYILKFVQDCKPLVGHLRTVLGAEDTIYKNASERVVVEATNNIVDFVNLVTQMKNATDIIVAISQNGKRIIDVLAETMGILSGFYMSYESRKNFNEHKALIDQVAKNSRGSSGGGSSSDGCYIATMVYGDYDHPQVMALRHFRDLSLKTSPVGRLFVKIYYRFSPMLVRKLKNKKGINRFIRIVLDQLIKMINK